MYKKIIQFNSWSLDATLYTGTATVDSTGAAIFEVPISPAWKSDAFTDTFFFLIKETVNPNVQLEQSYPVANAPKPQPAPQSNNKPLTQMFPPATWAMIIAHTKPNIPQAHSKMVIGKPPQQNSKEDKTKDKSHKPVIVIDPGHGYAKVSTGASSFIYTYKLQDNPSLTKEADVDNLPDYVLNDPDKWVPWHWELIKGIREKHYDVKEDPKKAEAYLVFDVASKLKELLEADGYKVLMTRQQRGDIQGADDKETRQQRINLANDNHADYFISIHADGVENNITATGSHVEYPNQDRKGVDSDICAKSRELAIDIFKYYTVVRVKEYSPMPENRGLQVFSSSNKTKRQILVEIGFVSTPKEAKKLFSSVDEIANQLHKGLIENISTKFYSDFKK